MFKYRPILLSAILVAACLTAKAQQEPLPALEQRMSQLAIRLLEDSIRVDGNTQFHTLDQKLSTHKAFSQTLTQALRRPESFAYPFDSLNTISILRAQDGSFRVFTWMIRDRYLKDRQFEEYHYYFGLIQRKYINPQGGVEYVVIPLVEMNKIPQDAENRILDHFHWLGGLYYPPRFSEEIPDYQLKYIDPALGPKAKAQKQKFYLLFGWNGADHTTNMKFVDVMTFHPEKKDQVIFGASVFYFDLIPKTRVVFRYSENAPFNLNFSHVKTGPLNLFKRKMIVFDHLAQQRNGVRQMVSAFSLGPDGSYDALNFYKKAGVFEWRRNVSLADKYNDKLTQRSQREFAEKERKRIQTLGPLNQR